MVTGLWAYTGLLVVVSLERLAELVVSKRNARWAFSQGAVEVGQAHYRVMTALHTAFLLACLGEAWLFDRSFTPGWGWVALAGVAAAQALRYWAILTLGQRWNTRIIVLPEAEPVTGGPYRFIKHPNYVAVVVELFCLPLVFGGWVTAVAFSLANAVLLYVRIRAEEEALGSKYAAAFEGKARFVPGGSRV